MVFFLPKIWRNCSAIRVETDIGIDIDTIRLRMHYSDLFQLTLASFDISKGTPTGEGEEGQTLTQ